MNKKLIYSSIILFIIIIIIFIKNTEGYNDDIVSRQALDMITTVYAESYNTVYFNNQYTTGDLLVGKNLHVQGNFNLLPRGVIVAYNSSVAPFSWAICDGTNGTPDLRGRFILGQNKDIAEISPTAADSGKPLLNANVRVGPDLAANLNTTGGEVFHKLTQNELPSHNHSINTANSTNEGCSATRNAPIGIGVGITTGCDSGLFPNPPDRIRDLNGTPYVGAGGKNAQHNILPPFYVLTYIMKL